MLRLFSVGLEGCKKGSFKFFDWQIAQSRVCFVPLYENKKNLSLPELGCGGVTLYVLNAPSMGR